MDAEEDSGDAFPAGSKVTRGRVDDQEPGQFRPPLAESTMVGFPGGDGDGDDDEDDLDDTEGVEEVTMSDDDMDEDEVDEPTVGEDGDEAEGSDEDDEEGGEDEEEDDDEDEDGDDDDEDDEDEDGDEDEEEDEDEEGGDEDEASGEDSNLDTSGRPDDLRTTAMLNSGMILKLKRPRPDSAASGSPASPASTDSTPSVRGGRGGRGRSRSSTGRRPGRPSRAELARREKEREERIARGEEVDEPDTPSRRRRGRRPRTEEEKAAAKEEQKRKRREAAKEKRRLAKEEKIRLARERGEEIPDGRRRRGGGAAKPRNKGVGRGRGKRRVLTDEEKAAREEVRKAKYEEFKRAKAEAKEKRAERNKALREQRKKKKEEEKKQREEYEKRMQALKASFLDENSHLSVGESRGEGSAGAGGGAAGDGDGGGENSQAAGGGGGGGGGSRSTFEMQQLAKIRMVTAETLFEYRWPLEGKDSEHYFLQEQVCEYLGIKSFKRKYPDVHRRAVDVEERDFLVEMGVANMTQADLGLTALPSSQVLDIMSEDFYDKYDQYMTVLSERKDRNIRQTNYNTVTVEKHHLADFVEKHVKSCAAWNKNLNQEKRDKRTAYFDMQTFNIHYPMNNRGKMRVLHKPKMGHYPVALIPGQFVDYYKPFTPEQMRFLPLNSATAGPPKAGVRLEDIVAEKKEEQEEAEQHRSDGESDDSDSSSSSSGSDSDDSGSSSDSDSESDNEAEEVVKNEEKVVLKRPIDAEIPGARCKNCLGDRMRNKLGQPEKLLHCSKCDQSAHPTCIGLFLELLEYVTNYNWECTECKGCSKCNDHSDEDKMLFCDLCDRGYHNYCVGLETIPDGHWHCEACTYCSSCRVRDTSKEQNAVSWVTEYKTGLSGGKVYSHSMCQPCHKLWKRSQYCPECNVCFGRELEPSLTKEEHGMKLRRAWAAASRDGREEFYANCWVCSRQHHRACVGQAMFICAGCQRRTQERCVGAGNVIVGGASVAQVQVVGGGGVVGGQVVGTFASPVNVGHAGGVASATTITRSGRRAGVALVS